MKNVGSKWWMLAGSIIYWLQCFVSFYSFFFHWKWNHWWLPQKHLVVVGQVSSLHRQHSMNTSSFECHLNSIILLGLLNFLSLFVLYIKKRKNELNHCRFDSAWLNCSCRLNENTIYNKTMIAQYKYVS